VIRRLTAFRVKEVNTKIRSTSHCTVTPGEGRSYGASEGKRKRVSCKTVLELFVTRGVTKPAHGVSTCSFCLSFGRERRTPPVSAEDGNCRKCRCKPSFNPWSTSDFARAPIEEHYEHSHPKMWGKFKARVAAAGVMSAAAVQQFFNMNKLDVHFRRATAGNAKRTISSAMGQLISSLYVRSISTVYRMFIHFYSSLRS
jgi:hypothetical protein